MVVVFLALNWFGDSLDGTVARVRNQQRPRYGFYVDHVIDLAGTACLFAGLAASGFMSPLVAALVVAGFFLVSAESFLATHSRGIFNMSFAGFGPTELRLLIAAGALTLLKGPFVVIPLIWASCVFSILAGSSGPLEWSRPSSPHRASTFAPSISRRHDR